MATRRKKASTRVPASQGARGKRKPPPKGGRKKATPKASRKKAKPKSRRGNSPVRKVQKKTPPKGGRKKAAPKKPVGRKALKRKRRAKKIKELTPKLIVQIQKSFHKLRATALKKKKLVLPKFTRRKGKLRLRGTDGKERTLVVEDFWEKLREGHWEIRANRAFESLWLGFAQAPTMYARFTFTVTKVNSLLTVGSPKLVRATRKKVIHWFFSSGLSYSLEGMRHQFQLAWDTLAHAILDAQRDNIESAFFLEYITCIAYVVKA
jgi:hypothetical protein